MSSGQQQQQRFAAAAAASLVRSLNNPYNVPAYTQPVNFQGYAYSSTYNPAPLASGSGSTSRNVQPPRRAPPVHWYNPGSSRCTHPGCVFTGSPNSLDIHMMDRHLIYPQGWHTRKRQDWDADPSLKGRPVPIMGTSVTLESPEDVEAWIAERKRHWPSAARVAEKKRKLDEAIASGGLHPGQLMSGGMNRPGRLPFNSEATRTGRGRGRGRGRGGERGGRGRGRGLRGASFTTSARTHPPTPPTTTTTKTEPRQCVPSSDTDSDDDVPEVLSAKRPPVIEAYESSSSDVESEQPKIVGDGDDDTPRTHVPSKTDRQVDSGSATATAASPAHPPTVPSGRPKDFSRRAPPPQPKNPPRNPFAAQTSLLRSLLLPEIRMTVSNLSQAIHFLVDNDFLENVELVPGQANEKRIEVMSEQPAQPEEGKGLQ